MTLLSFLTQYESGQTIGVFGLFAVLITLVIAGAINGRFRMETSDKIRTREFDESTADKNVERKEHILRLQNEMANDEHRRKSEWHVLTERPTLIERPRKNKQGDG